ncbi:hypothetical protein [Streptacidiphilus jiangxiensis]|uniref:Uncharacterized protein n=1 Tax=Streptacidiphilus jiangxiensis TaxID=235985 RepID=A0A1H7L4E1_STRJI|nr:hypothetical protein [Streptacidiphilus jiangxiensis]SEK93566.1 hypothetical protein SAMN05414137_104325 [Streptacidiphilus jiangxiensis]
MLGDLIGEEQGQVTAQRVVPSEHGLPPTVESSFQASGTLLGVTVTDLGTYVGTLRHDGTLYGEGTGVIMSPDGATASWRGTGVGVFTEGGSISWRGSIVYLSDAPAFAGLRGVAGAFEWETNASGKANGKLWAWR